MFGKISQTSGRYQRSTAFHETSSQGEQSYSITAKVASALQPDTVNADSIVVCAADSGEELGVVDAYYIPQQSEIHIELASTVLSSPACTVTLLDDVKYLDGVSGSRQLSGTACKSYFCNVYGVSIEGLSFYQEGVQVINPELLKPLTVYVNVANATGSLQEVTLALLLNGELFDAVEPQTISVNGNEEGVAEFYIPQGLKEDTTGIISATVLSN